MVLENSNLQAKWVVDNEIQAFSWGRFSRDELERLLQIEEENMMKMHRPVDVYDEYVPTNERLIFRIAPIDEHTVIFSWNHLFNNGMLLFTWFDTWLRYYAGEIGMEIEEPAAQVKKNPPLKRFKNRLLAPFWALIYIAALHIKSGKNAADETVDLTHAKQPTPHKSGYAVKTYHFTENETAHIIDSTKRQKNTPAEFLCAALVKAFFDKYPDKNRVLVNTPVDIRDNISHVDHYAVGNYSGSVFYQIFRNKSIEKQIHKGFRWFKHSVPYGVMKILHNAFKSKHFELKKRFEKKSLEPIPERAPMENYTCILSTMDNVASPQIEKMIDQLSITGKQQTIVICNLIVNGKLSMEVGISRDMFDPGEVFSVTDLAVKYLKD
jgi:hypothetical protein